MLRKSEYSLPKTIIILTIVLILTISSTIALTSYPQHIYLDNKTKFKDISFQNNNVVTVKGNQVTYNTGDTILLEGREYIKVTGKQQQYGNFLLTPAIRTLSSTISQNVLFEREIGRFKINSQSAQVTIDKTIINFIPLSLNIINIQTASTKYNIDLTSTNKTYLTFENGIMLKLEKNSNIIKIYIIGLSEYNNIKVRII